MAKCARTACPADADGFIHIHTGLNYCASCARKINEYNGLLVEHPDVVRKRKIDRLISLREEVAGLEADLRITPKDQEVVNDEVWDDKRLVVVADGLGGADLHYVKGHWPIEYFEEESRHYDSEDAACADCARLSDCYQGEGEEDWDEVIKEVFPKEKACKPKSKKS